jgi:uncharacterized protein YggT (Ycf19 family)
MATHSYFVPESAERRTAFTIERVLDFLFAVLYALLGTRLLLDFFGARKGAGFYELIRSMSDPFYRPFQGLFGASTVDGHPVVWPLVAAILGYMLLHAGLRGLLHLIERR